jgi:fatty-acyl-CoA synthase
VDIRTGAGIAAPLVDIRLVDAGLNDVPHDGKTPGEIVVRAPWLAQGYVDNVDASEQLWAGGYLHTDDIGIMEPGGYLRIVDRMKDVIKTGGEWVSSAQIEDLISQCKGVAEVAVIGIKDDKWGERPLALVVRDAQTGNDPGETQIKAHLKVFADAGVVSKYGIPDKILFVKTLPKTSVGKFNKKELREKYGNKEMLNP